MDIIKRSESARFMIRRLVPLLRERVTPNIQRTSPLPESDSNPAGKKKYLFSLINLISYSLKILLVMIFLEY